MEAIVIIKTDECFALFREECERRSTNKPIVFQLITKACMQVVPTSVCVCVCVCVCVRGVGGLNDFYEKCTVSESVYELHRCTHPHNAAGDVR